MARLHLRAHVTITTLGKEPRSFFTAACAGSRNVDWALGDWSEFNCLSCRRIAQKIEREEAAKAERFEKEQVIPIKNLMIEADTEFGHLFKEPIEIAGVMKVPTMTFSALRWEFIARYLAENNVEIITR